MADERFYGQSAPYWNWVADMDSAPRLQGNGEGPSHRPSWPGHDEASPPEYDGEDPPTPPEEIPGEHHDEEIPGDHHDEEVPGEHHDEKDPFDFFRYGNPHEGFHFHTHYFGPSLPPSHHHGPHLPFGPHQGPPPPGPPSHEGPRGFHGHRPRGPHGKGRHGHHGHHGPPPWAHCPPPWAHCPSYGRRGSWGGRGRGGRCGPGNRGAGFNPFDFMMGGMGGDPRGAGDSQDWGAGMKEMAQAFAERFGLDPHAGKKNEKRTDGTDKGAGEVDFKPVVDLYDTKDAYVVYISLPGAKKEDVGLTWDENSAALTIAGVVTRGVGEEMMESMEIGERDVGVFRRVIKLGQEGETRVDADTIMAKMENGILAIRVGKIAVEEEFVEVKKVDID